MGDDKTKARDVRMTTMIEDLLTKSDEDIGKLAEQHELPYDKEKSREENIAALAAVIVDLEVKPDDGAKKKSAKGKADDAAKPIDLAVRDRTVRAVSAEFCRAIPDVARSTGVYTVSAGSDQPNLPVPDGKFRVTGCDWVMEFTDGAWSGAHRAHANGEPDWIDIPDHG